jgi:hypothetical protein
MRLPKRQNFEKVAYCPAFQPEEASLSSADRGESLTCGYENISFLDKQRLSIAPKKKLLTPKMTFFLSVIMMLMTKNNTFSASNS